MITLIINIVKRTKIEWLLARPRPPSIEIITSLVMEVMKKKTCVTAAISRFVQVAKLNYWDSENR